MSVQTMPTVSARRGEGRFGKPEILKLLFSLAAPLCMVLVYSLNTRESQSTPLCNVNYGVSLIDQAVIRFKETVPNKPEHTAMEAWTKCTAGTISDSRVLSIDLRK